MRRTYRLLGSSIGLLLLSACLTSKSPMIPAAPLSFPSKDEVLLVNGRKLSLSGYAILRERYPNLKRDDLLWMGIAALAIQNDTQSRGREMNPNAAVELARFALNEGELSSVVPLLREYYSTVGELPSGPEFKKLLDKIISHSVVQRNPQVLAELH